MLSDKKVRVGIIGCGTVSRSHLRAYMEISDAEVVAVADVIEDRAKAAKQMVGAEKAYTDYTSLLERSDIDMVDICLPTFLHAPVAIEAAKAGKNVLVEKPMARNLAEADAMIEAAEKANVKLMVSQTMRFSSISQKIKQIVESGWIGKLLYIRTLGGHGGPGRPGDPGKRTGGRLWFLDPEKSGGGSVLDYGIHLADFMRYVAGEVSSVFAVVDTFKKERNIMVDDYKSTIVRNIAVDDHGVVILKFKSGAVGSLSTGWIYLPAVSKYEIFGSEGSILADSQSHTLAVYSLSDKLPEDKREKWLHMPLDKDMRFVRMIKHFITCIKDDKEPLVNGREGRKSLEVIMAAYESARKGVPVSLPLVKKTD